MTTFNAFKKQIVATLAVAVIATGAFATTTTHAEAGKNKHRIGAFVAGAIVGGALLAGSRRGGHYEEDDDDRYERAEDDCYTEKHVYWKYGERRVRYVEVCS